MAEKLMTMVATLAVAVVMGLLILLCLCKWLLHRVEEQRQQERLRQLANGHVTDMPRWLRRREEQLNRKGDWQ